MPVLAVLELLNDLRDATWAISGDRIQVLLQQQQGLAGANLHSSTPNGDDRSF
jgi:hypothetical protein